MLCGSLGITPAPNNGTLHLPLQPLGIHTPGDFEEPVNDPALGDAETATKGAAGQSIGVDPVSVIHSASAADDGSSPTSASSSEPTETGEMEEDDDDSSALEDVKSTMKGFWDWVKEKAGDAWGKVTGSG